MIAAILFDLDDTLLAAGRDTFLPAYFQTLAGYFAAAPNASRLVTEIINGSRAIIANTDPTRRLLAVFNDYFYPAMCWPQDDAALSFDDFYRQAYPPLRHLTKPKPAAYAVVELAFAMGCQVVIATSPLFPRLAVEERLRWAGLANFAYSRITTLENSHFAKPHPEYYAEILAHLGHQPAEALVVGNDWEADIEPAAVLGLPAYWITATAGTAPPVSPLPNLAGYGTLDDFLDWLKNLPANLQPPPLPPTGLSYLLAGNLAAIAGELADVSSAAWVRKPITEAWSPTEIICHLRDVEQAVHLPRLRAVIENENPFIAAADTDPWVVERNYQSQSGPQALRDLAAARRQTFSLLVFLPAEAWQRPARHALFGPTRLAEIVGWISEHDRIHLTQLKKSLAGRSLPPTNARHG